MTGNAASIGKLRNLAPLLIEPRPSRLLLVSGGGAHILASVAVVVSSLPLLWIKVGWIAGIALALIRLRTRRDEDEPDRPCIHSATPPDAGRAALL